MVVEMYNLSFRVFICAFHLEIFSCFHFDTFKCHVSCTDGKISVRINLFYLYFSPSSHLIYVCFCPEQEDFS